MARPAANKHWRTYLRRLDKHAVAPKRAAKLQKIFVRGYLEMVCPAKARV
jgi:hypothetical protein